MFSTAVFSFALFLCLVLHLTVIQPSVNQRSALNTSPAHFLINDWLIGDQRLQATAPDWQSLLIAMLYLGGPVRGKGELKSTSG